MNTVSFCPRCGTGSYTHDGVCKQCNKRKRVKGSARKIHPEEHCFSMCAKCGMTSREIGRPPSQCSYCNAPFPQYGRLHPAFTAKRGVKPGYW